MLTELGSVLEVVVEVRVDDLRQVKFKKLTVPNLSFPILS